MDLEHGLPAEGEADEAVADHGGHQGRNECFHLEVFAVEHLCRDDGSRERGLEHGRDASTEACRHCDSVIAGGKPEPSCDVRAGPGADLGDGAFTAACAATADCKGARDELDKGGL